MSNILLIKPRFLGREFVIISQPMGLMYIGATLKKAGHKTKIHDCCCDHKDLKILRKTITYWKPDFIGISIIITELEHTKRIVSIIREILPKVPIIFGGPWPSANPEEAIKEYGADFVVLGEGERVFPELINKINEGLSTQSMPGTVSVVHGNIKINPGNHLSEEELNALPFPSWELLDHKLYKQMGSQALVGSRPYMSIVTSRGCPYKCAYCHQIMGKIFRKRSAESILAEMEELRFQHGFKEFEIIDDCFNLDRERMYAILTGIRDRFKDVKLHFPNGLRADILEPKDLLLFKQAGTASACFAIETSSPRLQKKIHKNLNIEKVVCAINASVKAGIYSTGFFIIGFPTESYEEASDTVAFACNSSLHRALFFNPIPFAGTEMAEMVVDFIKNKIDINDPREVAYFTSTLNISAMSDVQLQMVFQRAYRQFYMNPKRILRVLIHHPNISSLPYYALLVLIKIMSRRATLLESNYNF